MEKEPIQKSNIKFNFKRGFLIKFVILIGIFILIVKGGLPGGATIMEKISKVLIVLCCVAILALVINYFHKWIWEFQHREKVEKSPVWKKWWFWLIIIVIILAGSIIIFDHTAKVNYCKGQCTYHITEQGEGIWSYWGSFGNTGYSTREECIEGCILNTDWEKAIY